MAAPKYRLTQPHYLKGDIYADKGSVVGSIAEGADYEWPAGDPPTIAMEALNEEAHTAIAKAAQVWIEPVESLPLTLEQ